MIDLKSMTLPELRELLVSMGEPAFRGKQLFSWLSRGAESCDVIMNFAQAQREPQKAE